MAAIEQDGVSYFVLLKEAGDSGLIIRRVDDGKNRDFVPILGLHFLKGVGEDGAIGAGALHDFEQDDFAAIIGQIVILDLHIGERKPRCAPAGKFAGSNSGNWSEERADQRPMESHGQLLVYLK